MKESEKWELMAKWAELFYLHQRGKCGCGQALCYWGRIFHNQQEKNVA